MLNNVIPATQHGFVPGRSVVTNLTQCLNHWTSCIDRGDPIDVIYLDFAKAFDRVPKRRLLAKLEHCGVRGNLLKWIEAFLSNRSFYVRVGHSTSGMYTVSSGVPQGTVLGPILFSIYVADISHLLTCKHAFYADDVKLYGPSNQHDDVQASLSIVEKWCEEWLIPLNNDKCTVLHLGRNNPHHSYKISSLDIRSVSSQSDLGVIITTDLSWSSHVSNIVKKANSMMYLLRKSFQAPCAALARNLFTTYIRPLVESAAVVWNPVLVRDVALVEGVQRRATKWSSQLRNLDYAERLERLALPSLSERRIRGDQIFTWRALHDQFSTDMSNLYELSNQERLRGHPFKLVREAFRTSIRQNFVTNRVFHNWNALPSDVVCASSINIFKNRYDDFISNY